jgi:hypothetical protein
MTTRGRSGCASVRIAALVVALLAAPIAFAESPLLPPSPKAPKIRVLLVMPAPSGKLSRRVALFDQALSGYQGRMSRARGLGDAEAIVEFHRVIAAPSMPTACRTTLGTASISSSHRPHVVRGCREPSPRLSRWP